MSNNNNPLATLGPLGLVQFQRLRSRAVKHVALRVTAQPAASQATSCARSYDAWAEDLEFHLDYLTPALEHGVVQPMVSYLLWLGNVLAARGVADDQLADSLEWLAEFFRENMPGDDGETVALALAAAKDGFLADYAGPSLPLSAPDAWPEADRFEAALLEGNKGAAVAIMEGCLDRGGSLIDFELHVIQPSLYRIGHEWQSNRVSVAQEHLATALAHSVMTLGLLRSTTPAPRNRRVLLACVEGNHHAVGLRMVSDAFQLDGFEVQYLGANVPTEALVQQAVRWKPHLLGLSLGFPQHLRTARLVTERLIESMGDARPAMVVGGLALNSWGPLAAIARADATFTDLRAAIEYGRRLPA